MTPNKTARKGNNRKSDGYWPLTHVDWHELLFIRKSIFLEAKNISTYVKFNFSLPYFFRKANGLHLISKQLSWVLCRAPVSVDLFVLQWLLTPSTYFWRIWKRASPIQRPTLQSVNLFDLAQIPTIETPHCCKEKEKLGSKEYHCKWISSKRRTEEKCGTYSL